MAIRIVSVSVLVLFLILPSTSLSWPKNALNPKDLIEPFTSQTSSQSPGTQVDIAPRVVNIGVGNQRISSILDISTEWTWNICVPFNNTSNFYNPSNSSTFSNISCGSCPSSISSNCTGQCHVNYIYIVKDNVVVGVNSSDITFACVYNASDQDFSQDYNDDAIFGVLGFSKGNLSLVRQLEYQRFSYCLPENATEAATVKFGSSARITGKNGSQSIQMIDNPDDYSYYLNLTQIKVGASVISINTSKYATVIDTYYPFIYLDSALYNQTREAILYEMGLFIAETNASVQELCFNKALMMPSLELQFDGNVSVTLEKSAYVVRQPNATFKCIGISRSQFGSPGLNLNVLGNLMQVDKNMVFDLEKKVLSFEKMKCGSATFIPSGGLCLVVLLFSFLVM